jgi:hypothetical protein
MTDRPEPRSLEGPPIYALGGGVYLGAIRGDDLPGLCTFDVAHIASKVAFPEPRRPLTVVQRPGGQQFEVHPGRAVPARRTNLPDEAGTALGYLDKPLPPAVGPVLEPSAMPPVVFQALRRFEKLEDSATPGLIQLIETNADFIVDGLLTLARVH